MAERWTGRKGMALEARRRAEREAVQDSGIGNGPEKHTADANLLVKSLGDRGHVEINAHYVSFDPEPIRLEVIDPDGVTSIIWLAPGEASHVAQALELAAQWSVAQEQQDRNLYITDGRGSLVSIETLR